MDNLFDIENLSILIRLNRSDNKIRIFLNKVSTTPYITVDKDDGADDEFIEFKNCGFGLHFMNDLLESIHFQSGTKKTDYTKFSLPLPFGIKFDHSKNDIQEILGSPDEKGGGHDVFFGLVHDWFKYNKNGYAVHVEFTSDSNSIETVTIMAP